MRRKTFCTLGLHCLVPITLRMYVRAFNCTFDFCLFVSGIFYAPTYVFRGILSIVGRLRQLAT